MCECVCECVLEKFQIIEPTDNIVFSCDVTCFHLTLEIKTTKVSEVDVDLKQPWETWLAKQNDEVWTISVSCSPYFC
jgi:hypothetical protein